MALNFLKNQGNFPTQGQVQSVPAGLGRFLQKKGINSSSDLEQRIQLQNPSGFLRRQG
ncbi:MAG: hypothetical protein P4L59_02780 [Desulfosporosinus sp.]|nr:hypothetical protein [Desulfosporosinus sp.]